MDKIYRITVTPEQAETWLTKYKADVQRPIRQKWVTELTEIMQRGEFDRNSTIQLRELNGEIHLVDGRHRLNAVIKSGTTQSFIMIADQVADEQQLLDAFRRRNESALVTKADYYAAMKLDLETGLSRTQLNKVSGAVPFIYDRFRVGSNRDLALDKRVDLIRHYAESAGDYFEAILPAGDLMAPKLRWAAVIAVGLITFDESVKTYGRDAVFAFWEGVARMTNAYPNDPRGVLERNLMVTVPSRGNAAVKPGEEMRSPMYTARYAANCFNAWVEGRTINRAVVDVGKPITIRGSKFTQ